MISKKVFADMVRDERIASIRVVPVPLESAWCIDAIIRMPMEAGSRTDTVAAPQDATHSDDLRRFKSIDAAAKYLRDVGVKTFTVDLEDSVSFVDVNQNVVRMVETSVRLHGDESDENAVASAPGAT